MSWIAACSTLGGIAALPKIPIPPAEHTARTRGAVAMNAIPALMNGTFSPYCSVMRVVNMKFSGILRVCHPGRPAGALARQRTDPGPMYPGLRNCVDTGELG